MSDKEKRWYSFFGASMSGLGSMLFVAADNIGLAVVLLVLAFLFYRQGAKLRSQ